MQPRVYINWGQTRPAIIGVSCHVMLKRERMATSIAEFKSYLTLNHGFKEVATSFGIMKFSTKISIHRHMKEPQFPNGRIFVCNTQDEWLIYRDFLSDKKATN